MQDNKLMAVGEHKTLIDIVTASLQCVLNRLVARKISININPLTLPLGRSCTSSHQQLVQPSYKIQTFQQPSYCLFNTNNSLYS